MLEGADIQQTAGEEATFKFMSSEAFHAFLKGPHPTPPLVS